MSELSSALRKPNKRTDRLLELFSGLDPEIAWHSVRVGTYSEKIFEEYLKRYPTELDYGAEVLKFAAILHDIGKAGVPAQILNKSTPLTEDEEKIYKDHTVNGAKAIHDLLWGQDQVLKRVAREVALCHHESISGKGYPLGISEGKLPLSAQIVSAANVFDHLTSALNGPCDGKTAVGKLRSGECGDFAPEILGCLSVLEQQF